MTEKITVNTLLQVLLGEEGLEAIRDRFNKIITKTDFAEMLEKEVIEELTNLIVDDLWYGEIIDSIRESLSEDIENNFKVKLVKKTKKEKQCNQST